MVFVECNRCPENLEESEFLEVKEVHISLQEGDYPGPPVRVVVCDQCGEEVMDNRHVEKDGQYLCRSYAECAYYQE